jgi:hypothetical protein
LSFKKRKEMGQTTRNLFYKSDGPRHAGWAIFLIPKPTRLGSFSLFLFYVWFKKIDKTNHWTQFVSIIRVAGLTSQSTTSKVLFVFFLFHTFFVSHLKKIHNFIICYWWPIFSHVTRS